ncbi:Probable Co/Zn/Cd efflux system membrane fusion protein [hydrothermal vent metagenome]|uniref:Probable Co/Zn/Cd efflux system membrane fusion protein n=1 Tax=hydrothermal vent metagenome TaxID=652676 RepID=A0A3B0WJ14_9ZZZZ
MNKETLKILLLLCVMATTAPLIAADDHDHEGHGEAENEAGHEAEHGESGHDEENHGDHEKEGHDGHGAEGGHEEGGHDDHGAESGGHGGHGEGGHEEEPSVKLTAEQMTIAGIVSEAIQLQEVSDLIIAPGEVALNAYKTTSVTPRVSAQVAKRHAKLGDEVKAGDPLLTLSSVAMASAQGELIVTEREWQRVKKLGRKVVSASRYTEARVAHEQAKARVLAYGMTARQVSAFVKSGDASKANGTFQLLATQNGTVIKDDFILGELIEPGRVLFVISDESALWVEAKLTPAQVKLVSPGNAVSISAGDKIFPGKVVQVHHALDEDTRTLGVRIEFANPDDDLHPGVFVQANIGSNNAAPALAVPVNAVLRSPDGDWMVFTESKTGEFEPKEIELVRTVGDVSVIEGLEPGTRVVTQGAFFVQSELAKSGFDPHNH